MLSSTYQMLALVFKSTHMGGEDNQSALIVQKNISTTVHATATSLAPAQDSESALFGVL